ncbi:MULTISPECIES: S9 family peptidase [Oceanicaulis]|uniref:S9 family peptidase n=1 Tax=Oceanicaulis TaxID=153232 RepID=UPI0012F322B6|nr:MULTISPECIES: S9 family peptidase [Oceanicaulis]VXC65346.1 Dipeptidyl aminopeptidase BI [Oceanicaulis sp. 350]|tara:strand:- start:4456 stop:6753 length:2298 start_codon:yes stop_codon:yes gene_type:complete
MTLSHYGSKAALLAGAALIALSACSQPAADSAATTTENSMNDTSAPAQDLIARALEISAPTPEQRPVEIEQLGRTRTDEFTWLRDDNWQEVMRDPSVLDADIRAHLEAENAYYNEVMAPLTGLEERLYGEMRGRIKEDDESPASRDGDWYYYLRYREGGQYPVFARRATGENGEMAGEEVIILDGDAEADGIEYFDLGSVQHSPDHRYLAYAVDTAGSEFYQIKIRDLETGEDIATVTDEGYGSMVWGNDSRTLYWVWRDDNNRPRRVYRQAFDSAEAELIYEETDPGYFLSVSKTDGDSWIVLGAGDHTTSEARVFDANDPAAEPILVSEREPGVEYSLTEAGGRLFVRTNQGGAVDFQIMEAPLDDPRRENWTSLIEHRPGVLVNGLMGFENWLVRSERSDALPRIIVRDLRSGEEHEIAFDEEAYALGMDGGYEYATDQMRFSYESPSTPEETYDYDMSARERTLIKRQEVPSGHNAEDYVVRRIHATARDGASVPVTILYHRDTPIDGSAPLLLYGYGSYGITIPASFSTSRLSLVDRGMVYAIAHIRGGMSKGYQWYLDGKLDQKTNTFNDFVDSGRALVEAGYTSEGQMVAMGGSAGGLLVGAAINQAPELFAGAIGAVPFVDVLTTMSDESLPLTPPEWPEWGNPITDPAAYDYILSYSPYDQVSAQDYPHVLATAGLTDPRVTYWEPAKWAARLRTRRTDDGLTLMRTNMGAGHGGASGRFDSLRERAEEYAFALMTVGLADQEAAEAASEASDSPE